ncbi:UNVERIFIED_CONTAM: hypothetical protein FKN15_050542 [Acipenser sinensis]
MVDEAALDYNLVKQATLQYLNVMEETYRCRFREYYAAMECDVAFRFPTAEAASWDLKVQHRTCRILRSARNLSPVKSDFATLRNQVDINKRAIAIHETKIDGLEQYCPNPVLESPYPGDFIGSAHHYHPRADSGAAKTNTRCPPKRVPSANHFFHTANPLCSRLRATVSEDNAALGSLQASPQNSQLFLGSAHHYHPRADSGAAKTNTRYPPKRVPSANHFFHTANPLCSHLRVTASEDNAGQLTGKPAGAQPDYRVCWCAVSRGHPGQPKSFPHPPGSTRPIVKRPLGAPIYGRQWNSLDSIWRHPGYCAHPALHTECLYWMRHS